MAQKGLIQPRIYRLTNGWKVVTAVQESYPPGRLENPARDHAGRAGCSLLDLSRLGQLECIININTQVPDGAFKLGMTKQ